MIASIAALSGPPAQAATGWSNPDGSSGPYVGWTPQALASGGGTLQLQWANTDGQLSLWRLNAAMGAFRIQSYGPYSPWTPQSLASGPDGADQANLSVADALTGYQYMAGLGMPIVSPACVHADSQWMKDFMAGANARGYRVDAVAIHWYGGTDANGFLGYIDYIHNLYGRDVCITEFAPADWSGNRGISPQQEADFMRAVLPALNSRPYVKRYSWFGAYGPGDAALGAAALWNDDGSLTALGKLYSRL